MFCCLINVRDFPLYRLYEEEFLLVHYDSGGKAAVLLPSSSLSLLLSAAD